ncbi:glycosyltransferase family 2 protein [Pinisolibacter aquiterrae]|uniref:glycosyltransferase family 2 protein n=1 Tax=Pinisolibacter aquiterrae TaxID=2815579 RepID=UPI001C3C6146|nr:glycosyltransferase family 2 protein [Pinisolibacter aquiterrae]MBV5265155.1 glycosyltransferase family 2 protein [Pinisolibacter aquiterrae]MCC8235515.1 glycosyltransferase family 2 protein [Pinisolibacter aquiterrae]
MSEPRLSAILITRDEAADLPDCLASLAFCDEIVVVDSGSTDATVAIAEGAGARVSVTADWPGFGPQKQRALDRATGDWVLSIDADERIPADLAAEIRAAIARGGAETGFRINRRSTFLGRFLLHGGWYPDRVLRLARRDAARFTPDRVHERLVVEGAVGDLSADMVHHSYRSIDEVLDKGRRYALASAAERRARGKRGGLATALLRATWAFLRHYLLKQGFRDGAHGFVAALAKAQETFWRWLAVGWER